MQQQSCHGLLILLKIQSGPSFTILESVLRLYGELYHGGNVAELIGGGDEEGMGRSPWPVELYHEMIIVKRGEIKTAI